MAKTITLTYNDKEYTLEYTKNSIKTMEENGFLVENIEAKPMSTVPKLFAGAFLAHHRFVKQEIIDEIFEKISNKSDFLAKLIEMLHEPYIELMEDSDGDEGNVSWGANW